MGNLQVGQINSLKINRVSEPGIYLISGDDTEVLLPNAYVTKEMLLGTFLDVFIYTDSEDRLVATTTKPYLYLNEIKSLEIVDVMKYGAFVNIGLPKDILVPKNKQKSSFNVGGFKVLQLQLDESTNRLIASEKFNLNKFDKSLNINDEVNIILYSKTPLGYKVVVNNMFEGMIYHNEIFESLNIGDTKKAYLKNIREDNKLDLSLQKIGEKVNDEKILDILNANGGEMNFTYKSDAQDIKDIFGMSKKAYKATLTKLLEENKIILSETSIRVKK